MAWPSGPVTVTELDQTTDSPAAARGQIYATGVAVNDIIAAKPGQTLFDTPYTAILAAGFLTESTWKSVGPTGSGATLIWSDLDNVPANASGLILRGSMRATNAGTTSIVCSMHARKTGLSSVIEESNAICLGESGSTGSTQTALIAHGFAMVNCDTSRRVDLYWQIVNGTTKFANIYLIGYFR